MAFFRFLKSKPNKHRHAKRGAILPLFAILVPALVGFMAVAIYTGAVTYAQDQLHAAALNAALAGSSSCNDDITTQSVPLQSVGINNVIPAAQIGWNKQYAASGFLQGIGASASVGYSLTGNIGSADQTCSVTVQATGSIPAPMLSVIGGGDIALTAIAVSAHDYQIFNGGSMGHAVRNAPAPGCTPSPSAYFFPTGPKLFMPITDRPGPDFLIISEPSAGGTNFPGYILEGCAGGVCWDLGDAANATDGGGLSGISGDIIGGSDENFSRWQTYPDGVERKVIFGPAVVDLGGQGDRYDWNVKKITSVRIADDGLPDAMLPGGQSRGMQLSCPDPYVMRRMVSWAHSQACLSQSPPPDHDLTKYSFYTASCATPPDPMSLW